MNAPEPATRTKGQTDSLGSHQTDSISAQISMEHLTPSNQPAPHVVSGQATS